MINGNVVLWTSLGVVALIAWTGAYFNPEKPKDQSQRDRSQKDQGQKSQNKQGSGVSDKNVKGVAESKGKEGVPHYAQPHRRQR